MDGEFTNPRIDSEINDLLQKLFLQIQSILRNKFVGMYVGGSIANHCFTFHTSDIDCYIITTTILPKTMIQKLDEMHKQLYSSKLLHAKRIEASYVPQKDLVTFNPRNVRPYFNEGNFFFAHYGSNFIIELYTLRKNGITVFGPDIKSLIKEISIQDLKLAINNNLSEYWESMLSDFSKLSRSDYQVFAILTMCRTLYSLETGSIASKTDAAKWAINNLEAEWTNLIKLGLDWKPNQELNKSEETQRFIRYVINKSRNTN